MKYENKEAFEQANVFGTGTPNTAFAQYFIGDSFLNPLTDPKGGLSAAQLCVRYAIQLGAVALPKTANPAHLSDNAQVDFSISDEDMKALIHTKPIADYGEFSFFPVFSGKPLA